MKGAEDQFEIEKGEKGPSLSDTFKNDVLNLTPGNRPAKPPFFYIHGLPPRNNVAAPLRKRIAACPAGKPYPDDFIPEERTMSKNHDQVFTQIPPRAAS
jgi:hypothetical protein